MQVYVIGATGFVGGGIAAHLVAAGHHVLGLARTAEAAERLAARGVEPHRGDLDAGRAEVVATAVAADAVVYAAQLPGPDELALTAALLDGLAGTDRALLFTSGTGVLLQRTGGAWSPDSFAEDDPFDVEPLAAGRYAAERMVREDGRSRGVVVRPGQVWGPGDHGHVHATYRSVAATGAACYVGDGLATYTHVHLADLARLYDLVLTSARGGAVYHAAAGEVPNRWIAEAVGADLGRPTRSLTLAEAVEVWGEMGALVLGSSSRSRDPRTRIELGWRPVHTDLLSTVGEPRLRALAAVPTP
ncbi:NAD-dependent epimerase/dehydratase family protein [Actinomycetospora termitidis]|uniref:NAD-dependent epimerase/dehydratase family protein n=1 Tax=Actinomycetospora termitidis TaxID=3053470 RepID=A0ABT7MC89_9PSEU|nr:NAD-dependent epimerase/dehydratase family protein [Actinomycetospora sp. Odt1-22]MDL5158275.1 NAD-dependent epimerase/dehydratase family protein [Actinomycetospora sp. Odt1-22]